MSAAGITLVPDEITCHYNIRVGELIKDAIDNGCRHFIIGWRSTYKRGGIGMLQALDLDFLDKDELLLHTERGSSIIARIQAEMSCQN